MWVEFVVDSLPCSERFFLRVLRFSPLLKNQHFQIPIRSGTHGHVSTSSYELLSAPWVNKLQFTIYNLFIARKPSRFVGRRCLLKALNGTGTKLVLCEIEIIFSPFIEADLVIKVKLLYSSLTSSHYRGKKI